MSFVQIVCKLGKSIEFFINTITNRFIAEIVCFDTCFIFIYRKDQSICLNTTNVVNDTFPDFGPAWPGNVYVLTFVLCCLLDEGRINCYHVM